MSKNKKPALRSRVPIRRNQTKIELYIVAIPASSGPAVCAVDHSGYRRVLVTLEKVRKEPEVVFSQRLGHVPGAGRDHDAVQTFKPRKTPAPDLSLGPGIITRHCPGHPLSPDRSGV